MSLDWTDCLLVAVLVLPAAAAVGLPFLAARVAKPVAVVTAALTLVASGLLVLDRAHPTAGARLQPWHEVDASWIPALGVRFHIGVDGLSWPLVTLTALLVVCGAVYLRVETPRLPAMLALIFALQLGIIATFLALDVVVFFLAFEVTLLPMFFLISGWGSAQRERAARKFLLYTFAGSVLLLAGVLVLATSAGTADIVVLTQRHGAGIGYATQVAAFVLLLLAFAVKSPLWPLHSWLPDAHTEAPTVGSVLLAGVMLKMGTYGLLRIAIPAVPRGAARLAPVLAVFAVGAIVMAALICLMQSELKRLIAYSSVGHMGFVLFGVSTGNEIGLQAAAIANIAHGVVTGLLFFLVGAVKERRGTGELAALGGLRFTTPRLAGLLGLAAVASFGLPGLVGFWGEFFSLVGAWRHAGWWRPLAVIAALGAALTVVYFLRMLRRVVAEPAPEPGALAQRAKPTEPVGRLTTVELIAFSPLVVVILLIGVWPGWLLSLSSGPVSAIAQAVSG